MCPLSHADAPDRKILDDFWLEPGQCQPVFRLARPSHGHKPCRWRVTRCCGTGRISLSTVVGSRAAHFLAARWPLKGSGGRDPTACQLRLGSKWGHPELQPSQSAAAARFVELPALAVTGDRRRLRAAQSFRASAGRTYFYSQKNDARLRATFTYMTLPLIFSTHLRFPLGTESGQKRWSGCG